MLGCFAETSSFVIHPDVVRSLGCLRHIIKCSALNGFDLVGFRMIFPSSMSSIKSTRYNSTALSIIQDICSWGLNAQGLVAVALRGHNVINIWKDLIGPSDPELGLYFMYFIFQLFFQKKNHALQQI